MKLFKFSLSTVCLRKITRYNWLTKLLEIVKLCSFHWFDPLQSWRREEEELKQKGILYSWKDEFAKKLQLRAIIINKKFQKVSGVRQLSHGPHWIHHLEYNSSFFQFEKCVYNILIWDKLQWTLLKFLIKKYIFS